MYHKPFFLGLFILFTLQLASQNTLIVGKISDKKGEPIIGANVYIEGTYDGTTSESDGLYQFNTEEKGEQTLAVSYIGYEDFSITLNISGEKVSLDIVLEETINELNEVVITAGAFEASDEKKSVVLKPLDIVLTAGATADLAGALNTLPGTQTVGEEGLLFVRGGASYETKTFIDGLLVLRPYASSVPDMPARNRFSPFLFKGTLFSTGGYSAEYGQALSAALVLQTQDLAPETLTSISLMSIGLGASHTQRWENSSLTIGGDYSNLSPYMSLINQNVSWHLAPQGMNSQLVYRKKTSETGMLKVMANASTNKLALDYPRAEDLSLVRLDLHNQNLFLNATYSEILNDKWSLFTGLAYTEDTDKIAEKFQFDTRERSAQLKLKWKYTSGDFVSFNMGLEYWNQHYKQDFIEANELLWAPSLQNNYGAAFFEANIYLSKKLVSRAGLRTEYSSIIDRWNVAPRWSLAYKTGDYSQFSFAYGAFFQNPENQQLIYRRDLNFERANHFMLNFQKIHNDRIFRIEAYEKNYDQLITFPSLRSRNIDNNGDGYARGIDLFYRDRKTFENVDFWLSYSLLDTRRLFRDFPESSTPNFASKHNLSIVYKQWLPKINTMLGWTYSYGSPRPYNDPNSSFFNAERTPTYHDLSFNASYLTNWFGNFTIVYVSVSNVFGFEQNFGRRFSTSPDANGQFSSIAVDPQARRFLFLGVFLSLGQERDF